MKQLFNRASDLVVEVFEKVLLGALVLSLLSMLVGSAYGLITSPIKCNNNKAAVNEAVSFINDTFEYSLDRDVVAVGDGYVVTLSNEGSKIVYAEGNEKRFDIDMVSHYVELHDSMATANYYYETPFGDKLIEIADDIYNALNMAN